tara:strand:+ start:25859 stop:27205 length:1347 start_codon:yes stop_codon:yes gene_type:complete
MARIDLPEEFGIPVKLVTNMDWISVGDKTLIRELFTVSYRYSGAIRLEHKDEEHGVRRQIGATKERNNTRHISAAYLLAKSHPNSVFFMVLPIKKAEGKEQRYWVVGIDNGEIIVGTDKVGDKNLVLSLIEETTSIIVDSSIEFCCSGIDPSDLGPEFVSIDPSEVFDTDLLLSIDRIKAVGLKKYVAAIALVAVAIYGYTEYQEYEAKRNALMERNKAARSYVPKKSASELRKEAYLLEEQMLVEMVSKRKAYGIVSQIVKTYGLIPAEIDGWTVGVVEFDQRINGLEMVVRYRFSSTGGSLQTIENLTRNWPGKLSFSADGKKAVFDFALNKSKLNQFDLSEIQDKAGLKRKNLIERLIGLDVDYSISPRFEVNRPKALPAHLVAPSNKFMIDVSGYKLEIIGFGLENFLDSASVIDDAHIPLVVSRVALVYGDSIKWEFEGYIYE